MVAKCRQIDAHAGRALTGMRKEFGTYKFYNLYKKKPKKTP